ncbi:MAG: TRAP transporter TatT component family protein [Syntrophobacteraceae bacterium]
MLNAFADRDRCELHRSFCSASNRWAARVAACIPGMLLSLCLVMSGCSLQRFAVDRLGNALAEGSSVYSSDDDPDLVGAALPFGLKTIESLLAQSPHNQGLLLAAASGFTQYSYAFVQAEADFIEDVDLTRATELRGRADRLYRRALAYGIRGLEEIQPGFLQLLRTDPRAALGPFQKRHVPQLYWTVAAWGAAISLNKTDPVLSADLPQVEAIIRRAIELDERYGAGMIHDLLIVWEGGRPAAAGGSIERARASFARAMELAGGRRAAPLVSFAETIDISIQDRAEFSSLLNEALAIDADAFPEQRLANLIAQKRARWLLARMDRLFLE